MAKNSRVPLHSLKFIDDEGGILYEFIRLQAYPEPGQHLHLVFADREHHVLFTCRLTETGVNTLRKAINALRKHDR